MNYTTSWKNNNSSFLKTKTSSSFENKASVNVQNLEAPRQYFSKVAIALILLPVWEREWRKKSEWPFILAPTLTLIFVPGIGIEPIRSQWSQDFKSCDYPAKCSLTLHLDAKSSKTLQNHTKLHTDTTHLLHTCFCPAYHQKNAPG